MIRHLLALAALGLALSLMAAGTAHGQGLNSILLIDERGDVWKTDDDGDIVAAPRQTRGDIRRTTIRHRDHTITVRTRFIELMRKPVVHGLMVRLETNTGLWRQATVFAGQVSRREANWRGTLQITRRNDRPVDCPAAHHIDYTGNVIRLRISRSCLDNPRWVRADVISVGILERRRSALYFDNANTPTRSFGAWTQRVHRP